VDYLAWTSGEYIGQPQILTVPVYLLVEVKYQGPRFRNEERIVSATFHKLEITGAEIVPVKREGGKMIVVKHLPGFWLEKTGRFWLGVMGQ
jgi:hypothetical protein